MDDLRRQFAALDAVPMPDIRAEIDRRLSIEPAPTVRVTTARQTAAGRPALVLTPVMVVLLVGLLITVVAGWILVGGRLNDLMPIVLPTSSPASTETSLKPSPSATASAAVPLDCAAAQASAAIRTNQWTSGPAPASPRAGWIAVWGAEAQPELVLVNPLTGETCSLITFSDFTAPPGRATPEGPRGWMPARGPLAWSPDGSALAIVVVDAEPCCRYALYVWSDLGLAGPIIDVREPRYLHVPSWSPDGSLIAVGVDSGSLMGPRDAAAAWLIPRDGSVPREVRADCGACFGGSVYWSPSGDRIAFRTWTNQDNDESLGIAAGDVDDQLVPLVSSTSGDDALLGWASDESLWVVASGGGTNGDPDQVPGHLFEVRLDPRADRADHGPLPGGPDVMPVGVAISPDGTQVLQFVERPLPHPTAVSISDLMVAGFPAGPAESLVAGSGGGPVWWSPDGRTIGYLIDAQTPDQGIWLVDADGTGLRKLVGGSLLTGGEHYRLDATLLKVWQSRP